MREDRLAYNCQMRLWCVVINLRKCFQQFSQTLARANLSHCTDQESLLRQSKFVLQRRFTSLLEWKMSCVCPECVGALFSGCYSLLFSEGYCLLLAQDFFIVTDVFL